MTGSFRKVSSGRASMRRCWQPAIHCTCFRISTSARRPRTFYTTGTTGLPKGVYYSHRQIVLHAMSCLATLQMTSADVYMPITPMFHVHAWGNPYAAIMRGMKQVYPGRYVPELLVKLFVQEGVTFSHCVPTIIQMFLGAAEGVDLRGWRLVIGGSALPRPLARTLLDRGVNVFSGYGMSETGPIVTVSLLTPELADGGEMEVAYRCRAGRPVALVDLQIQDAAGKLLPHDGVSAGEVVLRAPWLTMGYLNNPEASEALWEGGWLHTGDIGTVDAHGFLQITDRIKDVLKTGGEWVSSLELEDIYIRAPVGGRSGGDRRQGSALGRAAAGDCGTEAGCRSGRSRDQGVRHAACRGRHIVEIRSAGAGAIRRQYCQDQRGQTGQKSLAAKLRLAADRPCGRAVANRDAERLGGVLHNDGAGVGHDGEQREAPEEHRTGGCAVAGDESRTADLQGLGLREDPKGERVWHVGLSRQAA